MGITTPGSPLYIAQIYTGIQDFRGLAVDYICAPSQQ
jgi:hypothetical protein